MAQPALFTHFYSDPHYGHANIIKHSGRPFDSVGEMDRVLEERYCSAVGPNDFVLWCGDCFWAGYDGAALLRRLPGRKALVIGNHDGSHGRMLKLGFELVADRLHVLLGGHDALVCHYPPVGKQYEGREHDVRFMDRRPSWPARGHLVVHGHTHELSTHGGRVLHVGVDAWDFAPVSVARLETLCPSR